MKDEETLTEKLFEWLMFLQSYRVGYTIHEVLIKVQYWIKRLSGHIIHMSCCSKQQKTAYNIWVEDKTNSEVTIENFQYSIIVSLLQEMWPGLTMNLNSCILVHFMSILNLARKFLRKMGMVSS